MTRPSAEAVRVRKGELWASLPPAWPEDPMPEIRRTIEAIGQKVVVVDDDPTGTQAVHDLPVLTEWSVASLRDEMANDLPAFYILTSSRSFPLLQAKTINEEIGRHLIQASRETGRNYVVVSQSDACLRGHFPGEIEALEDVFDGFDAVLLIPFLEEHGRYTIGDVHYVEEGDWLVPVGQTGFARDPIFGFRASNLREWVEERFEGQFPAESVARIPLRAIREEGPDGVAQLLSAVSFGNVCIVNAASRRDLEVVVQAILQAESAGRRFVYRTASSFVAVRAGLNPRSLLALEELDLPGAGGGLVVVGSYVAKSSEQLNYLLLQPNLKNIEILVDALLSDSREAAEVERVAEAASEILRGGEDLAIYTSRLVRIGKTAEENLATGRRIAHAVASIVRSISVRPRYVLAGGGITASAVATQGLGIRRAMVLGQILPGIPVWRAGAGCRFPGLTYIVFPGNVGGPQDQADIVSRLRTAGHETV